MPRVLSPGSLLRHETVGQIDFVGDTIVYTLRRMADAAETTEIWTVPYSGGTPRRLAAGTCPRLDPTGTRLAYRAEIDDGPAQVRLIELADGSEAQLAALPGGVADLTWDPRGESLVVVAEDPDSERVIRREGVAADAAPTAIRRTRLDGRDADRLTMRRLYRIPLDGSEPQRLMDQVASRPRVGSDGAVYYLADPRPDADLDPCPQLYRDGQPLTAFPGGVRRFHIDRNPDRIAALAVSAAGAPESVFPRWYRWRIADGLPEIDDVDEPGFVMGLLGEETDLHDWTVELDDCFAASTISADGSTTPVAADGAVLVDGPAICGAVAADGGRIVAVLATPDRPAPDLYALAPLRRLTGHGDWLTDHDLPTVRRIEAPGPAGSITVFLVEPPDGTDTRATILDLHGGPTGQWGVVPPIEALLLAGAGYRVALPNIRGSVDRGAAWVAALHGRWGEADVADVLAVADHLVDQHLAEPGRLGVMGLSYGGFLTQYLIGVTDRFAAAVAENGVTNQITAWALSSLGPAYNRGTGLADPLTADGAAALWQVSPLRNVAAITTPLLMVQGGADRICPAGDNEQLFAALRALHRPVEYVLYPDEDHLMQATARIDRRIDRHERVLAHFETFLG